MDQQLYHPAPGGPQGPRASEVHLLSGSSGMETVTKVRPRKARNVAQFHKASKNFEKNNPKLYKLYLSEVIELGHMGGSVS